MATDMNAQIEAKKKFDEECANAIPYCETMFEQAVRLLQTDPAILSYFGLCDIKPIKDPDVTLRLNCRGTGSFIHMEYNPVWLKKIEEPSLLSYIIFAECMRIALHHITTRKNSPVNIFKLASDFICFDEHARDVLNSHKDVVIEAMKAYPTKAKFKDMITAYKFNEEEDWFLERVFTILCDMMKEELKQQMMGEGSNGESDESNDAEGAEGSSGSSEGSEEQKKNQNGFGKSGKKNEKNGKEGSQSREAIDEYLNPSKEAAEKATEGWDENGLVDQNIQEITHHIAESGYQWGNISGGLLQAILAANTPKLDPKSVLRRFKANTVDKYTEETRAKANRRHGFDYPGQRHLFRSRILIATDCSGSMSDEDVERACGIVNKFVKHADVSYCFWDGVCGPFEKTKKSKKDFQLVGRGCTNPDCIIQAIIERKEKFDGIIVISDDYFSWDRPEHYANKIFNIYTKDHGTVPDWIKYSLSFDEIFECV